MLRTGYNSHSFCGLALSVLIPSVLCATLVQSQTIEEVSRSNYLGQEVILLSDHSWKFADSTVTLASIQAKFNAPCKVMGGGTGEICPSAFWTLQDTTSDEGFIMFSYQGPNYSTTLDVIIHPTFGHDGAIEAYLADGDEPADGLLGKALKLIFGYEDPVITTYRLGDVAIKRDSFEFPGVYSETIELIDAVSGLEINLSVIATDDSNALNTEPAIADVFSTIHVDGMSLADIIAQDSFTHGSAQQ
ncbi:MAG: hypothetical protein ACPG5U_06960 [Planktomarina sp.]